MTDSLGQLKLDLREHEADVDEATETVRQIQAEMAVTEHIINRTQQVLDSKRAEEDADNLKEKSFLQARGSQANASLNALRAQEQSIFKKDESALLKMLANKKQSLTSMQAELEAEYPLLAYVQDLAAETKQQIADRSESLQASSNFVSVAQVDCQTSVKRADAQEAARVSAVNSIETALQALQLTGAFVVKQEKTSTPLSFVQVKDDVMEPILDNDYVTDP